MSGKLDGDEAQDADPAPKWLCATVDDLSTADLAKAMPGSKVAEYHALSEAYRRAAETEEPGDAKASRAYAFIGAVLSMFMKDDAPNDPFGPMVVMEGRRSPSACDFLGKTNELAYIADHAEHPLVRARWYASGQHRGAGVFSAWRDQAALARASAVRAVFQFHGSISSICLTG